MTIEIQERSLRKAMIFCARMMTQHTNGHLLIPTYERFEAELQRRAANDNVKERALALLKQSQGQKAA